MKPYFVSIQMNAIEQLLPSVLFVILFRVVLIFQGCAGTGLMCDQSNESYRVLLFKFSIF